MNNESKRLNPQTTMFGHRLRTQNTLLICLAPHWRKALLVTFLLLFGLGLQIANPLVLRHFIDSAQSAQPVFRLVGTAFVYLMVATSVQLLSVAQAYLTEDLAWVTTNRMRSELTRHCLQLDMSFHKVHQAGEMLERIDGDVGQLAGFFSSFVTSVIANAVMLVGVLAVMFALEWHLGLAQTAFTVIALCVLFPVQRIVLPHFIKWREASAEQAAFLEERVAGTDEIRTSGAGRYTAFRLIPFQRNVYDKALRARMMARVSWTAGESFLLLGQVISVGLSAYLLSRGRISIGTVFAVYQYAVLLTQPLSELTVRMQFFQRASASLARIDELFQTKSSILDGNDELPVGPFDVSVKYYPPSIDVCVSG